MAESKAKIEFQTKKELFEAIVDNVVCSFCEVVPRKGPIYQSTELTPKNEDSDDKSERPVKRPRLMVQKIACGECLPDNDVRFQRNFNLENMLYAYPITSCKFRKNDCKVIQDLKNIEYHEEDCEFRDIRCPYNSGEWVSFSNLKGHLAEIHKCDLDEKYDDDLGIKDKVFTLNIGSHEFDEEDKGFVYFFHEIGKTFLIHMDSFVEEGKPSVTLSIQLYGSKLEVKNYNCLIQMGDSIHGLHMFKGPINSIDDNPQDHGLVVSLDFAKKFIDEEGTLTVEIEIENLKPEEEQTDYEEPMEAAATGNDDKEKDPKN